MQSLFDTQQWLYNELDTAKKLGNLNEFLETPKLFAENLNPKFALRDYQRCFCEVFLTLENKEKRKPIEPAFSIWLHSGKTLKQALVCYTLFYKQ